MSNDIYTEKKQEFIKIIYKLANKKSTDAVFLDVVKSMAISYHNAVHKDESLEKEYMNIVSGYSRDEIDLMVNAGCCVIEAMEDRFGDFLGESFEAIGASNGSKGQFFTPYNVSQTLAGITLNAKSVNDTLGKKNYVTINDCSCGGGSTLIAGLDILKKNGINFQQKALVVGEDIDERCFWMCYLHMAVIGAPAIIYHRDTLTQETWRVLATPMYYINGFSFKPRERTETNTVNETSELTEVIKEVEEKTQSVEKGQLSLF